MAKRFIGIVGFGLIAEDSSSGLHRQVIFKDETTGANAEMMVSKSERPSLWDDVLKLEQGGKLPPYIGYITKFNTVDVVVFGAETIEEAFSRQKKKLNVKSKLTFKEAEKLRAESAGYKTNYTAPDALEISWRRIESEANIIKFRAYAGNGKFVWSNWHEIEG